MVSCKACPRNPSEPLPPLDFRLGKVGSGLSRLAVAVRHVTRVTHQSVTFPPASPIWCRQEGNASCPHPGAAMGLLEQAASSRPSPRHGQLPARLTPAEASAAPGELLGDSGGCQQAARGREHPRQSVRGCRVPISSTRKGLCGLLGVSRARSRAAATGPVRGARPS